MIAGSDGSVAREQGQRALRADVRHRLVAEDDVSPPAFEGLHRRLVVARWMHSGLRMRCELRSSTQHRRGEPELEVEVEEYEHGCLEGVVWQTLEG